MSDDEREAGSPEDSGDAPEDGDSGGDERSEPPEPSFEFPGEEPEGRGDMGTRSGPDEGDSKDRPADVDASDDPGSLEPDPDAPLGDLAASIEARETDTEPPEGVFSEEEVPEIDADVVWERLEEGDHEPRPPSGPEPVVRVVDTGEYCEQCPFFSEPPDVHCTHEGTEIRELVDMDHFRVVDCPKVAENERLENL